MDKPRINIGELKANLNRDKTKTKHDYDAGMEPINTDISVIDNTAKFASMCVTDMMLYPAKMTRLVLRGFLLSVMIFGSAGIGKTYGVMLALKESGRTWHKTADEQSNLTDSELDELLDQPAPTLRKISGSITRKGLYKVLYEHRKGWILIFDDCDAALKKECSDLMKAALDSGVDDRVISWETSRPEEGLPNSFIFESQIIFISNMTADKVDKAVRSRSADINLVLTPDEAYEHIGNVLPFIITTRLLNGETVEIDLPTKTREMIFEKISETREHLPEYSFRTFKMAVSLFQFCKEEGMPEGTWYEMWDHQQDSHTR